MKYTSIRAATSELGIPEEVLSGEDKEGIVQVGAEEDSEVTQSWFKVGSGR